MDIISLTSSQLVKFIGGDLVQKYKLRKRKKILDSLANREIELSSSDLESDEFISSYLATEDALLKASSEHKFNFLLNLFINGINSRKLLTDTDSYQEAVAILSELSERELIILYHIYNYESQHGTTGRVSERGHLHQVDYLSQMTLLSKDLIISILVRLRRTGLILTYSEKNQIWDLMLTSVEIMCISPLAKDIQHYAYGAIEGIFVLSNKNV